jgi:putative spermidine/putrescine transport system permease protein
MNQNNSSPILTTDGIPLKVSLQKSERKNKIRAFLLVAPLLFFILFTFLIPIGDMLTRSVDDSYINTVFPKTFEKYKNWDRQELPSEEIYKTMFFEIKEGSGYSIGKATTRMNYAKSGWKSLLKKIKT